MRRTRTLVALSTAVSALAALAACSGGSSGGSGSSSSAYTFWDPYPQFDASAPWAKLVQSCGQKAGVTLKRTALDTTELNNKALLAAQQDNLPDVMMVDNPFVSTLVSAGILTKTSDLHLDTSAMQPNIIGAGTVDNSAYGIPIGANTLALYYNTDILAAAKVDPSTIKDWASLTAALQKVKATGKKGISFGAIGTEEGTFQFLPWFWGAGGDLTKVDSSQGVAALSLWKNWVSQGLAPNDVLNNTQTTSWQEFATGQYAFGENGTWQLANAKKAGFKYGIINIPGINGGSAPVPTGGEFVTVPVQKDSSRYAVDAKIVSCLTSNTNSLSTDTTLSYIAPVAAVQQQQVQQDPSLKPWVSALAAARGRTSNGLGTKYPVISQQLWTAVQSALSGGASPQAALAAAQKAVDNHQN
ncbi:sugar ABC transporter substrate-binding protein [Actinacidiphila yeochonensis]|uniref:sugar ABC transporter substrate-binding protein n=1 Tax=Actinacidiphila yeochonensis TaxID=89050 RepID=UPI000563B8A2|nr:extracellular solute-binding protein [Actinacidiphila yeochonensis]